MNCAFKHMALATMVAILSMSPALAGPDFKGNAKLPSGAISLPKGEDTAKLVEQPNPLLCGPFTYILIQGGISMIYCDERNAIGNGLPPLLVPAAQKDPDGVTVLMFVQQYLWATEMDDSIGKKKWLAIHYKTESPGNPNTNRIVDGVWLAPTKP